MRQNIKILFKNISPDKICIIKILVVLHIRSRLLDYLCKTGASTLIINEATTSIFIIHILSGGIFLKSILIFCRTF